MKKFIPVLFTFMFIPTLSWASDTSAFTQQAMDFCQSKGGVKSVGAPVEKGDEFCARVSCKKTTSDDYIVTDDAEGPEANVEAVNTVCISKNIFYQASGAAGGAGSTAGSGGSTSGSSGGSTAGSTAGGSSSGGNVSTAGSSGGANVGDGGYLCEELKDKRRLFKGDLCYEECREKRSLNPLKGFRKEEGYQRKSCVSCLLKYPDLYDVDPKYLPKDSNGKVIGDTSVNIPGLSVRTGQIVCKDSNGNIVRLDTARCPSGSTVYTGSNGSGSGGSVIIGSTSGGNSGAGSVQIGGGVQIGGSLQLPAYCHSTKKADKQACEAWIRVNGRYACASSSNPASCMGDDYYEIRSRYQTDCVNCAAGTRQQSTLSGIAEIIGAIAPPLAQFGSAYVGAKAFEKSNKAWAGAAAAGFEQCRLSQQDYMNYLQTNELPGLTPSQKAAMNCNGYNLGQFAGMGGLAGWGGTGYSPGFLGGLLGPYGGYNPYGAGYGGVLVGNAYGGLVAGAGGLTTGLAGGYGYNAGVGLVGNLNLAGGLGLVAGYGTPGYGYTTGYGTVGGLNLVGSLNTGLTAGYGYNAGAGLAGNINLAGGLGLAAGYGVPGYGIPGYGGIGGNIGMPGWGSGLGTGLGIGGQYSNGYYGNTTGSFLASSQASNIDRMLQQQGVGYQMGMTATGSGGYSNFGTAGYHPANAGAYLGGQLYW